MKRLLCIILLLCLPIGAFAENVESCFGTLGSPTITAPAVGNEIPVFPWPNSAVQLVVGTCGGSYSIKLQGTINGTTWDDIELSGGSAAITQSTVGANSTDSYAIPAGFVRIRANAGTVTSCTLSCFVSRNP